MTDDLKKKKRVAPEMKVGLYFCTFAFALATIIYTLC